MGVSELAKELTVALINKIGAVTKAGDTQHSSKWVGEAYTIIYKAVYEALRQK